MSSISPALPGAVPLPPDSTSADSGSAGREPRAAREPRSAPAILPPAVILPRAAPWLQQGQAGPDGPAEAAELPAAELQPMALQQLA